MVDHGRKWYPFRLRGTNGLWANNCGQIILKFIKAISF